MRILFFARNTIDHRSFGGMEVVLNTLAGELAAQGVSVALATTVGLSRHSDNLAKYDSVWEVPGTVPGRYSRNWWLHTGVRGPWDEWEPDLVIGVGDAGGQYGRRRDRAAAFVVQSHGTPPMEVSSALATRSPRGVAQAVLNLARWLSRRRYYRAADEVWAVGETVLNSLRSYVGQDLPVVVLPNAVNVDRLRYRAPDRALAREQMGIEISETVAIFAGRLDRQKGVARAIDLLTASAEIDRLVIAGDGPDRDRLVKMVKKRGVAERVIFVGRVDPERLSELFSASDVMLVPSRRREGLPMSTLEAAASGLPVVASRTAGVPNDLLPNGRVAVVRSNSQQEWLAAAGKVLEAASDRDTYLPEVYSLETYGSRHMRRAELVLAANSYPRISSVAKD